MNLIQSYPITSLTFSQQDIIIREAWIKGYSTHIITKDATEYLEIRQSEPKTRGK